MCVALVGIWIGAGVVAMSGQSELPPVETGMFSAGD